MPAAARRSFGFGVPAWQTAVVVVAGYSLIAVVVAWTAHPSWPGVELDSGAVRDLWLAAMIWAGLTACIGLLVAHWPVSRLGYARAALLYGLVVAGASWVVNGAFLVLYLWAGAITLENLPDRLQTMSVLHMPFNAAAAVALIALFHWRRSTQEATVARRKGSPATTTRVPATLVASTGARRFAVAVESIEWIEGADDYVVLHCASGAHICNERLYRLESRLAASGFSRVHRSVLVNLHHVVALLGRPHGALRLELSSGRSVAVSRRRQPQVRQAVLCKRRPAHPDQLERHRDPHAH